MALHAVEQIVFCERSRKKAVEREFSAVFSVKEKIHRRLAEIGVYQRGILSAHRQRRSYICGYSGFPFIFSDTHHKKHLQTVSCIFMVKL